MKGTLKVDHVESLLNDANWTNSLPNLSGMQKRKF